MFPDQLLTGQFIDNNEKILPQSTSPIFIPSLNKTNQNSLISLLSVSIDDEHSISSSSYGSQRQRLLSSFEVKYF
jgi:hypothetical protein